MGEDERNVTLALSGGGLRAALFHLGVIAYLRESKTVDRVKRIFAISGGSIFAAHLSRHWKSCLSSSSDEEFRKVAQSLVRFCQSDLRGKLVRRQLLFFAIVIWLAVVPPSFIAMGNASTTLAILFTGTYLVVWLFAVLAFAPFVDWKSHGALRKLAYGSVLITFAVLPILAYWLQPISLLTGDWFTVIWLALLLISVRIFWTDFSLTNYLLLEYDKFFRSGGQPATLRQLQADQNSPEVHLIATSYTSGQIVWFDGTGVTICQAKHPPIRSNRKSLKLSYGVAASSAFPPAFPPVKMTPRLLAVDTGDLRHPEFLGDGGIYDNLGVEASFLVDGNSGNELLVSSAEQRFDVDVDSSFFLLPSRAARATDVLMSRVSEMTRKNASLLPNHKLIALADELPSDWLDALIQQGVRNLRTDLDRFSDVEVQTLYYYGYCAAAIALRGEGQEAPKVEFNVANVPLGTEQFWLPVKRDSREIRRADEYTLDRGAALKLGLWRWSDWKSWATLLVLIVTCLLSYPALAYYRSIPVIPISIDADAVERMMAGQKLTRDRLQDSDIEDCDDE